MNIRRKNNESADFKFTPLFASRPSWTVENVLPGMYQFGNAEFAAVNHTFSKPPKITVSPAELAKPIMIDAKGFMLTWNGIGEKPRVTVTITV